MTLGDIPAGQFICDVLIDTSMHSTLSERKYEATFARDVSHNTAPVASL